MKKRGLSPVIATMLLISLALILAVIIFFWARSFIGESISKQGSAIQNLCDDLSFETDADSSTGELRIENLGDVSIYGVEIRKQGLGEVSAIATLNGVTTITAGQTQSFTLPGGIVGGDRILVVPVLLGESSEGAKTHVCDEDYGFEIVVD